MNDVLMAIHPRYADAILAGNKRYEVRRTRPSFGAGSTVWMYATRPRGGVVGHFEAGGVFQGTASQVWRKAGQWLGVSRTELNLYADGSRVVYAIEVRKASRLRSMVQLPDATVIPQSYRYLRTERDDDRKLRSRLRRRRG